MMNLTNRKIQSRQGLFGLVVATWSKWSWIRLLSIKYAKSGFGFNNPVLDFLKEIHLISLLRSYWMRGLTCGGKGMRPPRESSAMASLFSLNRHIWTQSFNYFGVKEGPSFLLTTSLAGIIGLKMSTTSLQSVPKTSLLQCFSSFIQ